MLDLLAEGANTAFGFITPHFVTAVAMLIVFAIALKAGVPKIIAGVLDGRIAEIRKQLDDAKSLREEAAELKARYEKKAAEADQHVAELKAGAEAEAKEIVAKAERDATDLIARRQKMAEEKIAAAERTAIADLRAQTARAATQASRSLIAERYGAASDRSLVDEVITKL